MAYDAARGRIVVFAVDPVSPMGGHTWEWDGALWRERTPMTVPPAHIGHAMAFDAAHERVVMFGGDSSGVNSTWEWDGSDWIERRPIISPPALLSDPAMTYDAARQKVVLFGGETLGDAHVFQDRTWEWDGATWCEITTIGTSGPAGRAASAMTYDSRRGKVVLFGGVGDHGVLGDTWEYDGTTWTQPALDAPGPRQHAAMAFDAAHGKVVMFGGSTGGILDKNIWEWDGALWTKKTTGTAPQMVAPMVYDVVHSKLVLVSPPSVARESSETWEWDGDVWTQRAVGCSSCGSMDAVSALSGRPHPRSRQAMAYDATRATTVMFGGRHGGAYLSDTWVWSGAEWRDETSTISPPARAEHAMAFDMKRNRTVMFGGATADPSNPEAITRLDDTWEWDGSTWMERTPAIRPTTRSGHAMVYDVARAKTLLLGGNASEDLTLSDQCEWDGTSWTCATLVPSPPMRSDFALAYDAARGMVVLYGGRATSGLLGDTWEWDGQKWAERTTSMGPEPRAGHTLGYDATSKRIVLFGGQTAAGSLNDSWEWDGARWTKQPGGGTTVPASRRHHAMVYDAARRNLVMFAGEDNTMTELGDTWFLRYEDPSVPDEACSTGFDSDGDGKIGCDDPDCAGLCGRCGDGVCDAFENCRLCPHDCGECAVCGDLRLDPGETCTSCPGDCNLLQVCGDGRCDPGENCSQCPGDCGPCSAQFRHGG
jgi:hypothetical protein